MVALDLDEQVNVRQCFLNMSDLRFEVGMIYDERCVFVCKDD